MANEIRLTASLNFTGTALPFQTLQFADKLVSVSSQRYIRNSQIVGTSREVLLLGDVTPGYALLHNCDTTNYIDVFPDGSGAAVIRLNAGEVALFRFAASAPQVQANTAACLLESLLINN